MKKLTQIGWVVCLLIFSNIAVGQEASLSELLPFDQTIKAGTLDNGLKYFIKKNTKPENRVELRLVVNTGSVLEDDDQLGLAHFTEHMAFNGSKNFKKNELVDYLQSVGVKFGAHLNAYTSFDETVYILPIPSDNDTIVEKGLTILEDWSSNILFEDEEIEKERGVVIEEWRLGQGAQSRMRKKYFPVIMKDSKYADRLPIGKKEILENFKYETIKRFYKDWYRPNLMAVIAVGDIDVDVMEEKIKAHFGGLKNPKKARERIVVPVPDNAAPLVAIAQDKEATHVIFNVMYRYDPEITKTKNDYRNLLINSLFTGMLNQRLSDLTQQAKPPYIFASTSNGGTWARSKSAFSGFAALNENEIERGVKTVLEEFKRINLHGFNPAELKTQKLKVLASYERAYKERDKTESANIVGELVSHFLEQEPVPGIAFEYAFANQYVEGIAIDEVNALIKKLIKKENRIAYITGPDRESIEMPTTEDLILWMREMEDSRPEALENEEVSDQLLSTMPIAGKVISSKIIEGVGVTELTLSNGAKVFLKPTDFKNDEIRFSARREGGNSLASDDDYRSASMAAAIVQASGIGDFSFSELQKAMAGKTLRVSSYIGELEEGFRGNASPKDIETLLQQVYLYFTAVRRDEDAFQSLIQRNKAILVNILSNPQYYFQDKMQRLMSQDHLRGGGIPTVENLEQVDLDKAMNFFQARFTSPGDFTFWFVGSFESATLIPLIERYLGGIPAANVEEKWKDTGIRPPSGMVDEPIYKGTDPKSMVSLNFNGEMKYSREENYYLRSLSEVLDIRLIEILREEKGGVYGVGASGSSSLRPYESFDFSIGFPCAPENVDDLVTAALDVVREIQESGVSEDNLNKIKEAQRREMEISWKENGYWLNVLRTYHIYGYDLGELDYLDTRIENLTSEDLQKVANKYLDTDQFIKIVLYPEGYEK